MSESYKHLPALTLSDDILEESSSGETGIKILPTLSAGLDSLLTLPGGTTIELKIGSERKSDRKYVKIQALGSGIKYGFTNPAVTFDAFKNQLLILPFGSDTPVYITNTTGGNRDVSIAEV